MNKLKIFLILLSAGMVGSLLYALSLKGDLEDHKERLKAQELEADQDFAALNQAHKKELAERKELSLKKISMLEDEISDLNKELGILRKGKGQSSPQFRPVMANLFSRKTSSEEEEASEEVSLEAQAENEEDKSKSSEDIRKDLGKLYRELMNTDEMKEKHFQRSLSEVNKEWLAFAPTLDEVTREGLMKMIAENKTQLRSKRMEKWFSKDDEAKNSMTQELTAMKESMLSDIEAEYGYDMSLRYQEYAQSLPARKALDRVSFLKELPEKKEELVQIVTDIHKDNNWNDEDLGFRTAHMSSDERAELKEKKNAIVSQSVEEAKSLLSEEEAKKQLLEITEEKSKSILL
ncbi:MAG: hypothetical protein HQL32_18125 [Planctomycetes bacterium]|nr:hypothetical protein [Planctomycetota bacterium]